MLRSIATALAVAVTLSSGGGATAADKAAPQALEKVLLENEKVQVVENQFAPGAVLASRERPPRVVYYVTDAHFQITTPDGKTTAREAKAGSAAWRDRETSQVTNVGTKEVRVVVTYMK